MASNPSAPVKVATAKPEPPPKESEDQNKPVAAENPANTDTADSKDPEELIKPLKELITALEKRQKVAQEIGDYRDVLQSLVSGEVMEGEDLERAKQVVQSLGKLVKATADHQKALSAAAEVMPALDKILGVSK